MDKYIVFMIYMSLNAMKNISIDFEYMVYVFSLGNDFYKRFFLLAKYLLAYVTLNYSV